MREDQTWHGRNVLVTGGAGFIGSHLVKALVGRGARVRAVDNLSRGRMENLNPVVGKIEFCQDDLTGPQSCAKACHGMDRVFHLASKVGGIGYYMKRPAEVYFNNLLMDSLMFKAAQAAKVQRYLFASSAHIYPGRLQASENSAALKEEDAYPADPAISYGWAKLASEKLIQYHQAEGCIIRTAIVRIVGAFGENQDVDLETASAIPAFCRRAVEFPTRQPFTLLGQGRETRSYCYVGDIVDGMISCLEELDERQEIGPINLGNEGRITILELARLVIEASGKDIAIQHLPNKDSGIRGQAVDCARAREVLRGWAPKVALVDGVARTYRDIERRLAMGEK